MAEYILSEEAKNDINNIWIYTAEVWSIEQADRYYNLIVDEIEFIAENYELSKDYNHIRVNYRYSKVNSHFIFFRKADNMEMEVVRILHEKMDLKNRLSE